MGKHHFFVGTFRSPVLYTFEFDDAAGKLSIAHENKATGGHSWLAFNDNKTNLYTTVWTTPPTLASYKINPPSAERPYPTVTHLNSVETVARSGYVCAGPHAVYSSGGPSGDTVALDKETGAYKDIVQTVSYVEDASTQSKKDGEGGTVLDFGGLRHGGHSADLSPDGSKLYVADIGRNCIWVYHVDPETGLLTLASKSLATRAHDGPRHAWPHPNGKVVYSLQEHSSMVDVFEHDGPDLKFVDGTSIIPSHTKYSDFWADEVRLSPSSNTLFASTRGLEPHTKGYVSAFSLLPSGHLASTTPLALYETSTSGGWANAIQPAPFTGPNGEVWLALTDSEEGWVAILKWDGEAKEGGKGQFVEVDRVVLGKGDGEIGAATTVWYD